MPLVTRRAAPANRMNLAPVPIRAYSLGIVPQRLSPRRAVPKPSFGAEMSADPPIPEIYVLWHPACALGETLARRVHGWLRPGIGLGPQVFYRCLPAPEAPAGGLPPPLPDEIRPGAAPPPPPPTGSLQLGNVQILLLLIDANMIADAAWRHWLARLATALAWGQPRLFLPVALDSTAFNLPPALSEFNFLRPAGLPLPQSDPPGPPGAVETVARSLLKQLTEALCRLLLGGADAAAAPSAAAAARDAALPKVTLFLSHAKADGTTPARRIRDYIYSQTQLAAFYDENDIPYGSVFSRVLQANTSGGQTAALIAVSSARYATRPWCRREFASFRKPLMEDPVPGGAERWRLHPVLIVDALDGGASTHNMPEFGNTAVIRWGDEVPDQEEQIVTTVLREVLLAAYHAALGRQVPPGPDCIVLNWVPDPTTLLHIPRVRAGEVLRIYYPGRGLSGLELEILDEAFPCVEFNSFDQVLT